jgi:hypothetical protein
MFMSDISIEWEAHAGHAPQSYHTLFLLQYSNTTVVLKAFKSEIKHYNDEFINVAWIQEIYYYMKLHKQC